MQSYKRSCTLVLLTLGAIPLGAAPAGAQEATEVAVTACAAEGGQAEVPAGSDVTLRLPGYAQGTPGLLTAFLLRQESSLTISSDAGTTMIDVSDTYGDPVQVDKHLWVVRPANYDLGTLAEGDVVTVSYTIAFPTPLLVAYPPVGPSGDNGPYLVRSEGPIECEISAV